MALRVPHVPLRAVRAPRDAQGTASGSLIHWVLTRVSLMPISHLESVDPLRLDSPPIDPRWVGAPA